MEEGVGMEYLGYRKTGKHTYIVAVENIIFVRFYLYFIE